MSATDSINEDFDRLYEATKHSVLKYIAPRCACITDIEDIYQEVYLRVYEALHQEKRPDDPEAFVMGIAKHCVSHYYSLLQKLKMRLRFGSVGDEREFSDYDNVEDLVADRELCRRLFDDVCRCSPEVQKIFYLHYLMELSLTETAEALGITESRVKQLLYKTVRMLKRKYGRSDTDDR